MPVSRYGISSNNSAHSSFFFFFFCMHASYTPMLFSNVCFITRLLISHCRSYGWATTDVFDWSVSPQCFNSLCHMNMLIASQMIRMWYLHTYICHLHPFVRRIHPHSIDQLKDKRISMGYNTMNVRPVNWILRQFFIEYSEKEYIYDESL